MSHTSMAENGAPVVAVVPQKKKVVQYKTRGLIVRSEEEQGLCRCAGFHPDKPDWCKNPDHLPGQTCDDWSTDGRRCFKCEKGNKRFRISANHGLSPEEERCIVDIVEEGRAKSVLNKRELEAIKEEVFLETMGVAPSGDDVAPVAKRKRVDTKAVDVPRLVEVLGRMDELGTHLQRITKMYNSIRKELDEALGKEPESVGDAGPSAPAPSAVPANAAPADPAAGVAVAAPPPSAAAPKPAERDPAAGPSTMGVPPSQAAQGDPQPA